MSFLSQSKINRSLIQGARPIVMRSYLIFWEILVCALLIVSAACGQNSVTQSKHPATSAPITADPSSTPLIYRTTFSTSTTYTQAHELLTRLGLSVSQWDCAPRSERAGKILSAAAVLLTTPPPSQDTPEFFARTHELFVGYWQTPTSQQIARLKSSPQVVSVEAIPLVSC